MPLTSSAAQLTVTALPQASGWLVVYPANSTKPLAVSTSFNAGTAPTATVTSGLGTSSGTQIGVKVTNISAGPVDIVIELTGHYS